MIRLNIFLAFSIFLMTFSAISPSNRKTSNLVSSPILELNRGAQCQEANFLGAQCQGAHFWGAQCQGAYFSKAQYQEAHFSKAQYQEAGF
jgi:uncharacterized protein YjbI with pentapeptide repeats